MAKEKLRYKAAFYPDCLNYCPIKFTLPQLQNLYEGVYVISSWIKGISAVRVLSTGC